VSGGELLERIWWNGTSTCGGTEHQPVEELLDMARSDVESF